MGNVDLTCVTTGSFRLHHLGIDLFAQLPEAQSEASGTFIVIDDLTALRVSHTQPTAGCSGKFGTSHAERFSMELRSYHMYQGLALWLELLVRIPMK
jgi:hypothetical protein